MKNGYKTIEYLEENWTEKELRTLAESIEEKLALISQNPNLFQASDNKKNIRRVVIQTYNTLYYRFENEQIEIISFFSNRQNPKRRNLK
ncbi:MAG: type II toxin-antitoxin system RelE/ParE family toxin [Bacteroidota bacterium]